MTELVLESNLSEQQREYLTIATSSAESLLTIINEILDFSKIEAGQMRIESADVDIEGLLDEVVRSIALAAHQKSLDIAFVAGGALPLRRPVRPATRAAGAREPDRQRGQVHRAGRRDRAARSWRRKRTARRDS